MVTQTPNHDIDDYEPGSDTSWDHSDLVQLCEDRLVLWASTDGGKSNFDPHAGALFVEDTASPTVLYRGDGSTWNRVGTTPTDAIDGAAVAPPGSVQSTIDTVASNGGGLVRLNPTKAYQQGGSPWQVKSDVVLDFNGAVLYGSGTDASVDMVHVWPRARVLNAKVNTYRDGQGGIAYDGGTQYQGDVFTLDPSFNGRYFADGTTIQAYDVIGVQSTGSVLAIEARNTGTGANVNNSIGLIDLHVNFRQPYQYNTSPPSFANGVLMDNSFGDGWLNTINISGHWEAADVFLRQRGGEPMNQNEFHVTVQPDNSSHMWLIESGAFVRQNQMRGTLWDRPEFSDSSAIWEINSSYDNGGNQACRNNSTLMDNMEASNATNNGSNTHYVNNKHTLSSTSI